MLLRKNSLQRTNHLVGCLIGILVAAILVLYLKPTPAEEPMPYVLSEGVQKVAVMFKVFAHVEGLPPEVRPRYVDVLTFAEVVAKARAQARGPNQQPTEEDYFIALAWSCNIPWGPVDWKPSKPGIPPQ